MHIILLYSDFSRFSLLDLYEQNRHRRVRVRGRPSESPSHAGAAVLRPVRAEAARVRTMHGLALHELLVVLRGRGVPALWQAEAARHEHLPYISGFLFVQYEDKDTRSLTA